MSIVTRIRGESIVRTLPVPIVDYFDDVEGSDPNGVFITQNPAPWVGDEGQNIVFTGAATAVTPPLTYQWQELIASVWTNLVNGGRISGATTATLTITAAVAGDDGRMFRFVATNPVNSKPSAGAAVTVNTGGGETFFMLSEEGDRLLSEEGDNMLSEEAP